jgi:predicted RND superfamily exporter protein
MVGFAIIAFAPMPMFSSFGILTALMILMALVASLFVLPSLLLIIARDRKTQE